MSEPTHVGEDAGVNRRAGSRSCFPNRTACLGRAWIRVGAGGRKRDARTVYWGAAGSTAAGSGADEYPGRLGREIRLLRSVKRGSQLRPEGGCALAKDLLATGEFLFPLSHVFPDDLLEVIDDVQVNVANPLRLRVDVARNGNIDEEQGPVAASG